MTASKRLTAYLRKNKISYKTAKHASAVTTQEVAAAQHVPGHMMVKSVVAKIDGKPALAVVQAPQMVNFSKLKAAAGAKKAELATEKEIAAWIPECEVGAMTPLGPLYGLPVYADASLEGEANIVFNAESHTDTVRIAFRDFRRAVKPVLAKIAGA